MGTERDGFELVDLLASLVDKSLLMAETRCGRTRYRLSDATRQYALERLCESGESDAWSSLPGKPEEMAELLAFCASDKAGYLTGTDILNDGGVIASMEERARMAAENG